MRTYIAILALVFLTALSAGAQKYITKTGYIKFYSDSPLEKIEGHNRQVNSALDLATGGFVFKVLMKSFEFEKALMQFPTLCTTARQPCPQGTFLDSQRFLQG